MVKQTPLPDHNKPVAPRQLCDHFHVEEEARALATLGQPSKDQTALSNSESEVVECVSTRIADRQAEHEDEVKSLALALAELPDPRTDRNLRDLEQKVINAIMAVFMLHTPLIRPVVAVERNAKAAYKAWRDIHKRIDDPHYPASRIEHFALIIALWLFESICTAPMYYTASPNGAVGAVIMAASVAACTIGLGIAAGLGPVRYLNRPEPVLRSAAVPALFVLVLAIFFISFLAAHYRELAIANTAFDERQVLPHLQAELFALSLQSYVLLFFGLLFATIAGFKGHAASDPYPGYERRDRIYQSTLDNLNDLTATIRGGIDAVYQHEIVFAADKPVHAQALIDDINRRHTVLLFAQAHRRSLDVADVKAGSAALECFRTLNRRIRTDGVVPAYFAQAPDLEHLLEHHVDDPNSSSAKLHKCVAAATDAHIKHSDDYAALITKVVQHIERAKSATEKIMAAIEASHVDPKAIPDLAELRAIITGTPPHMLEDSSWSPPVANRKPLPNGAASESSPVAH